MPVRKNGVPPGQVSIRVRIDAGSLMENDDERGYAHLIEHLVFRGSKNMPDGEAIKTWQRLGATFGSDSNAMTTPTQTVYQLDLPDVTPEKLDESMRIIADMMRDPLLSKNGVKTEVPVVIAEGNEGKGAQKRISDAVRETFFAGQRLSIRPPIGENNTLNNATSKSVQAFHKKWYRPENMVVVVVGDGDTTQYEAAIKRYFGDWKVKGKAPTPPAFGDPDPNAAKTAILHEPDFPEIMNMAWLRPWRPVNDTIAYNEQILVDLLALQLINRRLERMARTGSSFLEASVSQDDYSRSANVTFLSLLPMAGQWEEAALDVRAVIGQAMAEPPAKEDLAREISEFDNILLNAAESADSEPGSDIADDLVNAVDIRETTAASDLAIKIFRNMKADITPERIMQATQKLFSGVDQRGILVSPEKLDNGDSRLAQIMTADISDRMRREKKGKAVTMADLPNLGTPGELVSAAPIGMMEIEHLQFDNGTEAIIFPNSAEAGKVRVEVRFGNGRQAFPATQDSLIWAGEPMLIQGGIGDLGLEELDRLTTGRKIGMEFSLEEDSFMFKAETKASDLADQLTVMAAKMAHPRWDSAPVERMKATMLAALRSNNISARSVLERDMEWLTHGKDPRWKSPDKEDLDNLTPEKFQAIWEKMLTQGPVEILLFGDFEREAGIEAIKNSFGALPKRDAIPVISGSDSVHFPKAAEAPVILRHAGEKGQAAVLIAWPTGGGMENTRMGRQLEILTSVFNNRLFERLRTAEGASYSPYVLNNWSDSFDDASYIGVLSLLETDKLDTLFKVSNDIAKELATIPIEADELERNTEPLRQRIFRSTSGNGFWMQQLAGATRDERKFGLLRGLLSDYSRTTPEIMQFLAQKFLRPENQWNMLVLGEGVEYTPPKPEIYVMPEVQLRQPQTAPEQQPEAPAEQPENNS